MVAVVLAAGSGTRLRPVTDSRPKCLVEVGGRTILDRLLDALPAADVDRVVIVAGYRAACIDAHIAARGGSPDVSIVRNSAYETTNNAASLAAARRAVGPGGFLLCDADVLFSVSPLASLAAEPSPCAFAVDRAAGWDAEAMKVELRPDRSVARIGKTLTRDASAGESIGIQKVGGDAAALLWAVLDPLVARDAAHAYYEDAFQLMIDRGVCFGTVDVAPGSWIEIDDAADLAAARERFRA